MDNFCPYFCQNFNLIIFLEGDWDDYFEPVNSRQDSDNFRDRSRGGRGGAPRFKRGGGPGYGRQVGQIDTVGENIIATIEVRNKGEPDLCYILVIGALKPFLDGN